MLWRFIIMAHLNKKLISATLIICLVTTGMSFSVMGGNFGIDNVYAEEQNSPTEVQTHAIATTNYVASANKNTIAIPANVIAGANFSFTLTGDNQNPIEKNEGDTRYVPYSYTITHLKKKTHSLANLAPNANGQYTYTAKLSKPASATITIVWAHQKYVGGNWVTLKNETTKKTFTVKGTLKYNANGGKVSVASKSLKQSAKAGTLTKPTKVGYKFAGWYTKKKAGSKVTKTTKIKFTSASKTIYARWTKIKGSYKITLNANGGNSSLKTMTVVKNKRYDNQVKLPTPTRANYNFLGWYTKKSGGSKVKNTTKVKKSSKHTLYARWKNKYTVTLKPNTGTLASSKQKMTVTLAQSYGNLPTPTKKNYAFVGWFTATSGGTQITNSSIVNLKADQVLYARWESAIVQSTGAILSSYDATAKSIIADIGKQGKSQCAIYCMRYCDAITKKIRIEVSHCSNDAIYAVWSKRSMEKKVYLSSSAEAKHTMALAEIKNQIDKGLPCIVRTTYNNGTGQHWLVVVGYTPNARTYSDLYILDPAASDVTNVSLFWNTKYYFPQDGKVEVATYKQI